MTQLLIRVAALACLVVLVHAQGTATNGTSSGIVCDRAGPCAPPNCGRFTAASLYDYCRHLDLNKCDLANGETPSYPDIANDRCCPTCEIASCYDDSGDLPACASGEKPTIDSNGCPTCRVVEACHHGGLDDDCDGIVLATCDGTTPAINSTTCCPTCSLPSCDNPDRDCSGVRHCEDGERPTQLPEDHPVATLACCPSCRPDLPVGHCSDLDFVGVCVANLTVCEPGMGHDNYLDDNDLTDDDSRDCCPVCVRPERLCKPEEVASCASETRDCADDERPFTVPGSCCPSCIPRGDCSAKPCNTREVCLRPRRANASVQGRCVRKRHFLLHLRRIIASSDDWLDNASCPRILALLRELGARLCDKPMHADVCARFTEWYDGLECEDVEVTGDDDLKVQISIPAGGAAARSVFAAAARASDTPFADALFADSEAMSGFSASIEPDCSREACDSPAGTNYIVVGSLIAAGIVVPATAVAIIKKRKQSQAAHSLDTKA